MCPISYAQPVTHQITWVDNGALVNETLGCLDHVFSNGVVSIG